MNIIENLQSYIRVTKCIWNNRAWTELTMNKINKQDNKIKFELTN